MYYIPVILNQIYSNVVPFVVLLSILVFVHELGHFVVARLCKVKVEVFSLGFGKKLISYKKGDTVYCVSLIPLGGYVKMFGEQGAEGIQESEKPVSFTHKTVWQRIAIVLAGPMMNFLFAIFVFGLISQLGEETRSAVIAEVEVGSEAAKMNLQAGDRILEVAGVPIESYEDFQKSLNKNKEQSVPAVVEAIDHSKKNITLKISSVKNPNIFSSESTIGSIEGISALAKSSQIAVIKGSVAEQVGFKTGDEVTLINGEKIQRWSQLESWMGQQFGSAAASAKYQVTVERGILEEQKTRPSVVIEMSAEQLKGIKSLQDLGFEKPDLYLEQVVQGSPAEQADLKKFDRIVSINHVVLEKWEQVLNTIKSFDGKEPLDLTIIRDGVTLSKKITPQVTSQMTALGQEDKRYTIGILPMVTFAQPEMIKLKSPSVFASFAKGFTRTIDISTMTVLSFVKLFQGEVSHKNIGGMLSIGKAAKDSFEMGLQSFLMTMGILSVSLFILNLLPIPVLDGGHLVFYVIEVIKGSPLSVKKMEMAQQIGFVLLMGLMVLALFNDFTKFFFKT